MPPRIRTRIGRNAFKKSGKNARENVASFNNAGRDITINVHPPAPPRVGGERGRGNGRRRPPARGGRRGGSGGAGGTGGTGGGPNVPLLEDLRRRPEERKIIGLGTVERYDRTPQYLLKELLAKEKQLISDIQIFQDFNRSAPNEKDWRKRREKMKLVPLYEAKLTTLRNRLAQTQAAIGAVEGSINLSIPVADDLRDAFFSLEMAEKERDGEVRKLKQRIIAKKGQWLIIAKAVDLVIAATGPNILPYPDFEKNLFGLINPNIEEKTRALFRPEMQIDYNNFVKKGIVVQQQVGKLLLGVRAQNETIERIREERRRQAQEQGNP